MVITLLIIMIIVALFILFEDNLETITILFLSLSLCSVTLFFIFQAIDVALSEAVIGVGLTAVILLFTIKGFNE